MEVSKHNSTVSIAKGICIILMVVGHSGCPPVIMNYLAFFHMPFFFFISGYLLKPDYVDNPVLLIKKRVKTLWWPYFKFGFIFLLLHNLFYQLHFYETPYSYDEILRNAVKLLFMLGHEELIGGFWFLRYLFYGLILTIILLWAYKKLPIRDSRGGGYFIINLLYHSVVMRRCLCER